MSAGLVRDWTCRIPVDDSETVVSLCGHLHQICLRMMLTLCLMYRSLSRPLSSSAWPRLQRSLSLLAGTHLCCVFVYAAPAPVLTVPIGRRPPVPAGRVPPPPPPFLLPAPSSPAPAALGSSATPAGPGQGEGDGDGDGDGAGAGLVGGSPPLPCTSPVPSHGAGRLRTAQSDACCRSSSFVCMPVRSCHIHAEGVIASQSLKQPGRWCMQCKAPACPQ